MHCISASRIAVSLLAKRTLLLSATTATTTTIRHISYNTLKNCHRSAMTLASDTDAAATANPAAAIKQVVNNVTKSPEDKHDYRAIVLSNSVRAMLVSDPKADRSAVSACVHAGSLCEPKAWQGLAHFCEHMLFLGTDKYPDENSYANFISEHGGMHNAYTADDHTCYYFDIAPDHLGEAMDRFSQFFLRPLFTESATEREVQAVHSEHTKNIPLDVWRMQQLEHELANPSHDFAHFFTGSLETLLPEPGVAPELRNQLLKFHASQYSANRLTVAVLGSESLDQLQDMVVGAFAGVVDKSLPVHQWDAHPFDGSECGVKVYAVTLKDVRTIQMVFPIPDLRQLYRGAPERYLGHLIGHEGSGSILAYLKRQGWSNALTAGCGGSGANGFDSFRVSLDLTEEGAKQEDAVIATVFAYIAMLRRAGPQEWIYQEERDLEYLAFRFKDKAQPVDLTQRLSVKMLSYPLEDVLTARIVLTEYMPERVTQLLDLLTPERCKIFIGSQAVADKCDKTEKYYGTQYGVHKIEQDLLEACTREIPELCLPKPNPFISTNFDLKPQPPTASAANAGPRIVQLDRRGRLWHRQDNEYHLPKACYTVDLVSPAASTDSYAAVCSNLYFLLLADALNSLTYDAELAGLNYRVDPTDNGALLHCSGYNDRLPVLLDSVLQRMAKPDIDPVRFASIYDYTERSLKNFKLEQPYRHCSFHLGLICKSLVWTPADKLEALANVTLDGVLQFGRQLQSRLYIEALVYGNATPEDAESVAKAVHAALSPTPLPRSEVARARDFLLPAGSHHLYRSVHEHHNDSACAIYFQIQPDQADAGDSDGGFAAKIRCQVLARLLVQVVQESFFDSLRTKQQLGYIVGAQRSPGVNTDGLLFVVQSERHPVYLEERIDAFVDTIGDDLRAMPAEQFQSHVSALNSVITEKPKKMISRNQMYFDEISRGTLCFDRKERLSACLMGSVSKEDLLEFYSTWLEKSSPARRRLSLHVVSEQTHGGIKDEDYVKYPGVAIANVAEFQRRLVLGPLPLPAAPEAEFCTDAAVAAAAAAAATASVPAKL